MSCNLDVIKSTRFAEEILSLLARDLWRDFTCSIFFLIENDARFQHDRKMTLRWFDGGFDRASASFTEIFPWHSLLFPSVSNDWQRTVLIITARILMINGVGKATAAIQLAVKFSVSVYRYFFKRLYIKWSRRNRKQPNFFC